MDGVIDLEVAILSRARGGDVDEDNEGVPT